MEQLRFFAKIISNIMEEFFLLMRVPILGDRFCDEVIYNMREPRSLSDNGEKLFVGECVTNLI